MRLVYYSLLHRQRRDSISAMSFLIVIKRLSPWDRWLALPFICSCSPCQSCPPLGLVLATWLGYNATLGPNQLPEVALNMRYLTNGMLLLSAVLQFVAYGIIFNLDKKTLAKMQHELGHDAQPVEAKLPIDED